MDIEKNVEGKKIVVKVSGRLDTKSSPELNDALKNDLPNVSELIFDFEGLNYISSSGLRIILSTQKLMNKQGTMVIKNVNEFIMEVFDATGFTDILTIE
ncbi:MAG: STAS domain-containing protein [Methanobrevibacter sp.]|jgi:anti-sigma B factor antagonist|nr:STAS domain-containing protein [Candidatus Methanovirga australis]MDR2544395.1 STAS domain-containing protein [Candidatus Methanovirga procula]